MPGHGSHGMIYEWNLLLSRGSPLFVMDGGRLQLQ